MVENIHCGKHSPIKITWLLNKPSKLTPHEIHVEVTSAFGRECMSQ